MSKKYNVILFDMDGTIADTDSMIVHTYLELYKKFTPKIIRSEKELLYFSGPPLIETIKREFPDYSSDEVIEEYKKISLSLYEEYVKPFPFCRETIITLRQRGYNVGIVTNKHHALAMKTLEVVNLKDVVDLVLGIDDFKNPKPDPSGINIAERYFQVKKEKILYVGDNDIDYQTAVNGKVDSMIVTWGPRELSETTLPTYKINSFSQLVEAIEHDE